MSEIETKTIEAAEAEVKQGKSRPAKKRTPPTLKQRVIRLAIRVAVIAAAAWILTHIVGGVFICHTSDMYPAVKDGDLVITYRLGTCRSTDIVVYERDGKDFFGRVIGEPGDEIDIDENGTYTVNGTRPYETVFYETKLRPSDTQTFPYTVKEGELFVLADAREEGMDSRNFGPVTETKGKVVLTLRRRGF